MGWTKRGVVRIKKLTAKQEGQIQFFAEKWNKIATSTEPWDEEAVCDGIKRFYKAMGCRQPKRGFWYDESPLRAWNSAGFKTLIRINGEFQFTHLIKRQNPNFWNLERSEWAIRCFLSRSFESTLIKQVEDFMHRNVARSLSVRSIADLEDASEGTVDERIQHLAYGQVDAAWLAIADYFATVHGNEFCQKIEGLMQAVASCGFVWLTPDKVVYCNRPEIAKFDDQGRLHCEDGPAIKYRDGWSFYYLYGVATPIKYIENPADDLKLDEVLKETNGAVRMALIRKFGFARLIATAHNRIVSQADGNALIEFKLGSQAPFQYLRALRLKWQDKTGAKETMLPVPRLVRQFGEDCPENVNDCEQVRRWTLGWPKEALAMAET